MINQFIHVAHLESFRWGNLAREKENWKEEDIFTYPFQLRYLEVLGSIFTCTIMFRYTFVIPFPANTPKWSFSVLAQWTGGVTVVFSCLTLVYVWKLRINAELSNCRSVKHHNMPYRLFWRCFYHFNPIHPT